MTQKQLQELREARLALMEGMDTLKTLSPEQQAVIQGCVQRILAEVKEHAELGIMAFAIAGFTLNVSTLEEGN